MENSWPLKSIAECASPEPYSTQIGPFGKALMAHEYTPFGVPVLRGVNVNHGRFRDDDFVFISEEKANQLNKFESYPKDVLLVHKGTIGPIGIMPTKRKYRRYILGNSMMRVRCDRTKLLPEFLYYWLSSPNGQHYLFSRISQVGVPQLQTPLTTLRQATLLVPSLPEQQAITGVLGKLDEKIELNEQNRENLEAITNAIFKQWFIDFEFPNEEGKPYKSSGGGMIFNEEVVEQIPKGWEAGKLGDIIELTMGLSPRGEYYNVIGKGLPLINGAADFSDGRVAPKKFTVKPTRVCKKGDLLFCIRGTIGNLTYADKPYCLGRGVAAITTNDVFYKEYVYLVLEQ